MYFSIHNMLLDLVQELRIDTDGVDTIKILAEMVRILSDKAGSPSYRSTMLEAIRRLEEEGNILSDC